MDLHGRRHTTTTQHAWYQHPPRSRRRREPDTNLFNLGKRVTPKNANLAPDMRDAPITSTTSDTVNGETQRVKTVNVNHDPTASKPSVTAGVFAKVGGNATLQVDWPPTD